MSTFLVYVSCVRHGDPAVKLPNRPGALWLPPWVRGGRQDSGADPQSTPSPSFRTGSDKYSFPFASVQLSEGGIASASTLIPGVFSLHIYKYTYLYIYFLISNGTPGRERRGCRKVEGLLLRVSTLGSMSHSQGARPSGVVRESLPSYPLHFQISSLPSTSPELYSWSKLIPLSLVPVSCDQFCGTSCPSSRLSKKGSKH